MIHLSQRDPKWGGKTIGPSPYLIKDYGCVLTSISMLSDWYGCYKDPSWMAKNLSYTKDALLFWDSVTRQTCFKFVWRFYRYDAKILEEYTKDPKKSVVINVRSKHWVVCVRKSIYPWSTWYKTVDPWTGRYNWYHSSEINGGATFIKR